MPITVSRLPSGWHAMPVMQRLLGLPSPCSACQIPSLPSSACPPCSSGLRLRREAALLGKAFLSERICMPSRASLFLHFSLLLLVLLLLSVSTNFLKLNGHPWAIFTYSLRDELFPNLVAHPVGIATRLMRILFLAWIAVVLFSISPIFTIPSAVLNVLAIVRIPLWPISACYQVSVSGTIGLSGILGMLLVAIYIIGLALVAGMWLERRELILY
ncbi:MAG: hypothetical protein ACXVBU_15145 [Ktedonobacteraceae bacterium]